MEILHNIFLLLHFVGFAEMAAADAATVERTTVSEPSLVLPAARRPEWHWQRFRERMKRPSAQDRGYSGPFA